MSSPNSSFNLSDGHRASDNTYRNSASQPTLESSTNLGPLGQIIFADPRYIQTPQLAETVSTIREALPQTFRQLNVVPEQGINQSAVQEILAAGRTIHSSHAFFLNDAAMEEVTESRYFHYEQNGERLSVAIAPPSDNDYVDQNEIFPELDGLYLSHIQTNNQTHLRPRLQETNPSDNYMAQEPQQNRAPIQMTARQLNALMSLFDQVETSRTSQQPQSAESSTSGNTEANESEESVTDESMSEASAIEPTAQSSTTTPRPTRVNIIRGEELSRLAAYLTQHPDSLQNLKYYGEAGFGHGITREIFTEAFKQIEQTNLFYATADSGALHVKVLADYIDDAELRKYQLNKLDEIGRVIAALYHRKTHGQDIIPQAHFTREIYRAIQALSEIAVQLDEYAINPIDRDTLIFLYEAIWETPLTPILQDSGIENIDLVLEQLCIRDQLDPLIAFANGFNLIYKLGNSDTELSAAKLEQAFYGVTLRGALKERSVDQVFDFDTSINRLRGQPVSTEEIKTQTFELLKHYIVDDQTVSEDAIKVLNQFITGEQFINDNAIIKINVIANPTDPQGRHMKPRPRARTCLRTLDLTEIHITDYETFKREIETAIIENGNVIQRDD